MGARTRFCWAILATKMDAATVGATSPVTPLTMLERSGLYPTPVRHK
jgi:hypothetical protein